MKQMLLNNFEAKIFGIMLEDEFNTAIRLPVFNGRESGQQELFNDWMLEFKAGVKGVESALNLNFLS